MKFLRLVFIIPLFFHSFLDLQAAPKEKSVTDSIMDRFFYNSYLYKNYIKEYEAEVYVKGITKVPRKNRLIRFAKKFSSVDKKGRESFFESIYQLHYYTPDVFVQKIKAFNGTDFNIRDINKSVSQFSKLNIYNATSFNNEILMPTTRQGSKYYRYLCFSNSVTGKDVPLKIRISPVINSQKLVSGYMYVDPASLVVSKIELHGKMDFYTYTVSVNFGKENNNYMLPVSAELELKFKGFGNEILRKCFFYFKYSNIKIFNELNPIRPALLPASIVKLDSFPLIEDSSYWKLNRPVPLSSEEMSIEEKQMRVKKDEKELKKRTERNFNTIDFASTIDALSAQGFDSQSFSFKYSGIVNPFKLSYSGLDGFVYWQQLKLDKKMDNDKFVSVRPSVGYVFKRKELFVKIPFTYTFSPRRFGGLSATIGNRNNSYNSTTIGLINKEINKDSIDFEKLNLKYYKHYYLSLRCQYEIFNGFLFSAGIDYLFYKPVRGYSQYCDSLSGKEADKVVNHNYKSFSPVVELTWTPGMSYLYNGVQKIYTGSKYPTFSFEYSRGIDGLLGGKSSYERLETDVQQKINLGLLRSLQYYFGLGLFTNERSIYFADFSRFQKNNFPESWDDGIGGVFHLLENDWYNSANGYAQLHLMYESPFFLLPLFKKIPIDIVKERVYFSQLYTQSLPNYTELGYGVGNYIFNIGVFINLMKGKCNTLGLKFAFELK